MTDDNLNVVFDTQTAAMDKGWRPKEEWEGNPEEWVDSDEFIRRGELMDKISSQTRQMKGLESRVSEQAETINELKTHHEKVAEIEYEKAMKALKDGKVRAMENEEFEKAMDYDDKIADLKEDKKATEKVKEEPAKQDDPEVNAWMEKNSWYSSDAVMTGAAEAVALEYVRLNPEGYSNPKLVLDYIDKKMREEFPNKFEEDKTSTAKRPSASTEVTEPAKGKPSTKSKYNKKHLNEMQRGIADRFSKAGVMTIQEYVDQLEQLGELEVQRGIM
jgi:excinuclease UvrABC nuclease subunit